MIVAAAGPSGVVPPPAPVVALAGDEPFLKRDLAERMARAFAGDPVPPGAILRRRAGTGREEADPREILDEVRTPDLFVPRKVVIVSEAEEFARAFGDILMALLDEAALPGRLILDLRALDGRTKLAAALKRHGALILCRKPFDRPPPWRADLPPWKNDLADWIVFRAKEKGLTIDARDAHLLSTLTGTQLAALDEELEKLRTLLGDRKQVRASDIESLATDASRDSVFDLVDAILAGDARDALEKIDRLCRNGYVPAQGSPIYDPATIALLAVAALAQRYRVIRRGHGILAAGGRAEDLVEAGLVARPFLSRLQRDIGSVPAEAIGPAFERLLQADRELKGIAGAG
ncbi:MAG: DNA polymerase III subunit delta, partial [Planctomycetes bacterium]|nr:DNA polymerase III subunit delta [Planctomycetota bacterium]